VASLVARLASSPATSRRAGTESAPLTEERPAMSLWWLVYNRDDRLLGVVIVEADGPAPRVLPMPRSAGCTHCCLRQRPRSPDDESHGVVEPLAWVAR
jgi:hypothetical protein